MRTTTVAATLLALCTVAKGLGPAVWNPPAWVAENTVELRTTDPGEEPHWFPVWHVVLDGKLYVRLGSRAAGRFDRNGTKPVIGVRIAGNTFERVRGILAPEMVERVQAAMADKYWTQADFIVRRMSHPYTLRLEPEPEPGSAAN